MPYNNTLRKSLYYLFALWLFPILGQGNIYCNPVGDEGILIVELVRDESCKETLSKLPPGVIFNRSDPCALFVDESRGGEQIFDPREYSTETKRSFKFRYTETKILSVGTIKASKKIILSPGDSITLHIDDIHKTAEITGNNAEAQILYNELQLNLGSGRGFPYWLEQDPQNMLAALEDTLEKLIAPFLEFESRGYINSDFLGIVKRDITYYFPSQITSSLKAKLRKDRSLEQEILETMEHLYQEYPISLEDAIMPNSLFRNYVLDYLWLELRKEGVNPRKKGKSAAEIEKEFSLLKALCSDKGYEYYAPYLMKRYLFRLNSGIVKPYTEYKSSYPTSNFPKLIGDLDRKYEEMMGISTIQLEKDVIFLPTDSLNTLEDLAKHLNQDRLYVDLWASWCGPCFFFFQYKDELGELLQKNQVKAVYISLDNENAVESWKNRIKEFKVKGVHLRANKSLIEDIRQKTSWNGSIPQFLLIDSEGNISQEDVANPSDLDTLAKQLNSEPE